MSIDEFYRLTPSYKVLEVRTNPDPKYILHYLAMRLGHDLNYIEDKFKVRIDTIRRRVYISGDYESIAKLFNELSRFGIKYESVYQSELRIDLSIFYNYLR